MRSRYSAEIEVVEREHRAEMFFDYWRDRRREYYAKRRPRQKRRAAITMVHNEAVFLPIWLDYYSRFFGPEDLHVLDNETTDGSTDRDGFVRVPVSHGTVDHKWMVDTVAAYQHDLLDEYDVVLVTDVDEIVVSNPGFGDLGEYIDRFDEPFVNAFGYELIHLVDREPPFRPDLPVLSQRHFWFANDAYSKPVLAMEPMEWDPGFHTRADGKTNFDPDLLLIHLHRMDYEICRARHRLRSRRSWSPEDLSKGWATHNQIVRRRTFDRWFYTELGLEDLDDPTVVEEVPEAWRMVF